MITAVFVYGTLKRGQCRSGLWPAKPLSIQTAWTRGTLFGRSDYPAMTAGTDRVLGELWSFVEGEMPGVITSLDQIEGTNQPGQDDLYFRIQADTWDLQDRPLKIAHVYHYARDPIDHGFVRLQAAGEQFVQWPSDSGSIVPNHNRC